MGFMAEKLAEHEAGCEAGIQAGDAAKARFHAAKAAEFCYALAKQTAGGVAAGYVSRAEGWLEIAEKLKGGLGKRAAARAPAAGAPAKSPDAAAGGGGGEGGEDDGEEFLVTERPDVCFDDIDGMEEAKAAIRELVVYPMKAPEKARAMGLEPGGGVLLYGPPGNGKTLFGKAIAHEIEAPFFHATGAQLRSKWHGESEQRLSRLLAAARSRPTAVLFLDEVDGLLPRRTAGSSVVDNRMVTQFLADVGGFKGNGNALLILGATNKPWAIDEAVFRTGRFDEKLYIGLPDGPARLGMLKRSFRGVAREGEFALEPWAERLEGYTGSDITGVAKKARQIAFRRSIEEDAEPVVLEADLAAAKAAIPSSVTPEMIKEYERFNAKRF
jgi:transitional endoplasmic reticulum ATPase